MSVLKLGRGYTISGSETNRNSEEDQYDYISASKNEKNKPVSHEIGVGSDLISVKAHDAGTDIVNLVQNITIGCMTQVKKTVDIGTTNHIEVVAASSQVGAETKEMGSDGIPTVVMVSHGTMADQVQKFEQEVDCQILISDDDEKMAEEEKISCFKCLGSQVNKNGTPCRKCNGSGIIRIKGLGEIKKLV